MERLAALRYSKALFNLALQQGDSFVDDYNAAAEALADVFESDEHFLAMLKNPSISRAQKSDLVQKVLQDRVPTDFLGLIELVLKRGREEYLIDIFRHFTVLYNDYKRIAIATVTSPTYLEPHKIAEIKVAISQKINKSVEILPIVDPTLIAGICIEVDGFVFDTSIKAKLADLKKQLMNTQVKIGVANESQT